MYSPSITFPLASHLHIITWSWLPSKKWCHITRDREFHLLYLTPLLNRRASNRSPRSSHLPRSGRANASMLYADVCLFLANPELSSHFTRGSRSLCTREQSGTSPFLLISDIVPFPFITDAPHIGPFHILFDFSLFFTSCRLVKINPVHRLSWSSGWWIRQE